MNTSSEPLQKTCVTDFFTTEKINEIKQKIKEERLKDRKEKFNEIVEKKFEEKKQIAGSRRDKAIETDNLIFGNNKLLNYQLVNDLSTLKVGDHVRYCQNVYKSYDVETKTHKRKSIYAIIKKKLNNNNFEVNSYGVEKYPNWRLDPNNKYKDLLVYIKPQKVFTGECFDCKGYVKYPYKKCYDCSMK